MQTQPADPADIAALRAFNRVYTRRIGLLHDRLDDSPFSLAEARILYELAHRERPIASDLSDALDMDRAQLSRILRRFEKKGLVAREQSPHHAKHMLLTLTDAGRAAFDALVDATTASVGRFLSALPADSRRQLLVSTRAVTALLSGASKADKQAFRLRAPKVGDLGWVIHRQAVLYGEEYGWDWTYEALIAGILSAFVNGFDAAREQVWIAEADGAVVGSIFLMATDDPATAKLRLLYVEPTARGMGIGRALVDACIAQARAFGYWRLELWTNSVLVSARRIYEAAGFVLEEEAPHRSFGHELIGQTWALAL
ncbi:MAG: MarR family transcriptional regulator [Novosphingobium sp.]|nr:MarR family transcriptional regulator [Novosphingobium sp.]